MVGLDLSLINTLLKQPNPNNPSVETPCSRDSRLRQGQLKLINTHHPLASLTHELAL